MAISERWKRFRELPPDIEDRLSRLTLLFEREDVLLATLHLYRDTAPMRRRQREYLKRRMAQWSSDEKL